MAKSISKKIMEFIDDTIFGLFQKIFRKRKVFKLGIYGPTNAGKTTIANRISLDWLGEEVGKVSNVPHETREIQQKERVEIKSGNKKLLINLIDTPGIATKIDFEDFTKYGMSKKKAKKRAKEATKGVIEAIKWLDEMDVVLVVMDASKSPYNQVNLTLLGNLEARDIPILIAANKVDLKRAKIKRIQRAFPQYTVVGISAKQKRNIEELYEKILNKVGK